MDLKTSELLRKFEEYQVLKGLKAKTVYYKLRSLKNFFGFIKGLPVHVTKEDIRSYLEHMGRKKLSSVSYGKTVGHIHEFYDFLLHEGHVLLNPAVSIERPKQEPVHKRRGFTVEEIRKILDAVPDTPLGRRDRAVIDLLYSTGMRVSELSGLDMEDVDLREREISVLTGKGGKERIVPVGEEALKSLEVYLDERYLKVEETDRKALFLSFHGGRFRPKEIADMIRKYKRRGGVGFRGLTHAFRHSCAGHMLKNGAPVEMIRRLLGHEYLCSTERYTGVSDEDLKRVHGRTFNERFDV